LLRLVIVAAGFLFGGFVLLGVFIDLAGLLLT
jgi:hypothetical protein